jgi:hypothetical protein
MRKAIKRKAAQYNIRDKCSRPHTFVAQDAFSQDSTKNAWMPLRPQHPNRTVRKNSAHIFMPTLGSNWSRTFQRSDLLVQLRHRLLADPQLVLQLHVFALLRVMLMRHGAGAGAVQGRL